MKNTGLNRRIVVGFSLITFLCTGVSGLVTYHFSSKIVTRLVERYLTDQLKAVGSAAQLALSGGSDSAKDPSAAGTSKLREFIKEKKLLSSGYFYVLDGAGTLVIHPAKEGQNVLDSTDAEGKPIFREIIQTKSGLIDYTWRNSENEPAKEKVAVFEHHPILNWYIAASVNKEDVEEAVHSLRWVLALVCACTVLVMIVASALFGRNVSGRLVQISSSLQESSNQVKASIEQLTVAGTHVSQSAATAASSLEETVASLGRLNSIVDANSEHARQAASLSSTASSTAEGSEKEIRALIASIKETAESSKKMEEIINVIDDIAFQTNLLALNASVEAARAGEHGKGFAVVADAVRALAQRSASSAKEISTLIQTSVKKMEEGSAVADRSGACLAEVLSVIRKVSAINAEIAGASAEQATGIREINAAMGQLDQSSQSNAATAEELATTAEQIRSQVGRVTDNVGDLNLLVGAS